MIGSQSPPLAPCCTAKDLGDSLSPPMAPAQSPGPPWAGTHILIPGVPQHAGKPQGWVTGVGPTGYTQLTLSTSQLRASVIHCGMQTSSQTTPGAWLGHLRVGCSTQGVREVTLSQSQSREWLGHCCRLGSRGMGPGVKATRKPLQDPNVPR